MSIIEEVSNFRLAIPLKNRSAKSIAKVLEDRLISVFAPKCIVADKGTNLVLSKEVMKVLDQYGVAFHVGSAYASRSHGKIGQEDTNSFKLAIFENKKYFQKHIEEIELKLKLQTNEFES